MYIIGASINNFMTLHEWPENIFGNNNKHIGHSESPSRNMFNQNIIQKWMTVEPDLMIQLLEELA